MWAADNRWTYAQALRQAAGGAALPFGGRAGKSLVGFATQLEVWQRVAQQEPLDVLFDIVMNDIGYGLYLREISETTDEAEERMSNVAALRGYLADSRDMPLRDYLEQTALASEADTVDEGRNGVTLLTLHAAKGLEYPVVFITGVEDGLLPHSRSISDPEAMQEERRLFYVGVTRARDRLYLTYAFRRSLYGESQLAEPSRFLGDIPADLLDGNSFKVTGLRDRSAIEYATRWERDPAPAPPGKVISFEERAAKLDLDRIRDKYLPPQQGGVRQGMPPRPAAALTYTVGMRVFHPRFGEGVVLGSQKSGDDEEVEIQFGSAGRRVVSASFANLVILGKS
jgi:DNA helicase-2/ATP-dependent DNA helicase PcrA